MKGQFLGIILIALAVFLIGVPAFAEYQIGTCNVGTLYANATTIYYGELYVKLGANWVKSSPRKMGVCANNGGTNVLACSANANMMSSYNKAYYTLTGTSKANFIMAPGSAITCGDSYKIYPWPTDWIGYMHLYGGDGNDYLFGSPHGDGIHGGSGTNYFYPMGGQATDPYGADLYGSGGDDYYYIAANDIIHQLVDSGGNNRVEMDGTWSSQAENKIWLGDGNDTVFGGIYDDHIEVNGGTNLVFGFEGDDYIFDDGWDSEIYAGEGSDEIYASDPIIIWTGPTDDAAPMESSCFNGSFEPECIESEGAINHVYIEGGGTVYGCDTADHIECNSGGADICLLYLMGGNDTADTGYGDDEVWGGAGNDTIHLGGGDDGAVGDCNLESEYDGTDHIEGEDGEDVLYGCGHGDYLSGGPLGDDNWSDYLNGGSGNDQLLNNLATTSYCGDGPYDESTCADTVHGPLVSCEWTLFHYACR